MFNEKEVIPDILGGNIRAFESLVKQYENLVFLVINRLVNSKQDAEDICQEVFVKAYKNLGSFGFQSKFSTWIARIAYLTAINHLKKYKKDSAATHTINIEQYHFTHEDPEKIFSRKDNAAYVNRLIEQMPVQYKTVLTLYHLNEFSYQEIENITGMPEGTVKSYLYRARKLLKEKLEIHIKKETL